MVSFLWEAIIGLAEVWSQFFEREDAIILQTFTITILRSAAGFFNVLFLHIGIAAFVSLFLDLNVFQGEIIGYFYKVLP